MEDGILVCEGADPLNGLRRERHDARYSKMRMLSWPCRSRYTNIYKYIDMQASNMYELVSVTVLLRCMNVVCGAVVVHRGFGYVLPLRYFI